ncbi:MAG: hypothetical protein ACI9ES_000830 [Oceanospirillaceae bacterium]|jgi:hypothetical protein
MKKPLFEIDNLDDTNRGEYRLSPSDEDNLKLVIAGKEVEVVNISGNGISFKFTGNVKKATYKVILEFAAEEKHRIECAIKVLRQDPPVYSGTLIDLTPYETRAIGQLIINSQKRAIRRGKG